MTKPGSKFQVPEGLEVPEDVRKLLDQGVAQAREGFDKAMSAAGEVVAALESKSDTAQVKAAELRKKSLALTETSMAAAFDLVQKLVGAKSIDEVMKLQAEYLAKQFTAVRNHIQEAGEEIQRHAQAATEEMAAEAAKIQAATKDAIEKGVASVKNAAKPK